MRSSIVSVWLLALGMRCAMGQVQEMPRVSPEQAVARAKAIIAVMTLDEKIAQAHGIQDENHFRMVPGNARLGIPALRVTNGPAGVGPGGAGSQQRATALPAPIALAATWDTELSRLYGQIAGQESRATGSNLLESPDINIARVPQGGRVFEGYGEDPFLVSRIATAQIEGIQSTGVMANVKHYLANNQETQRGTIDELIDERTLHEIYMPAFEASVKDAHVASVMCAYPRINGTYNCENEPLLRGMLRSEWAFDGFVTSDFGAVHSTVPSAKAGLDLEMPTGVWFGERLKEAIERRKLPESALDAMLIRRFSKMIEFGWGDPQPVASEIPVLEHGALSRKIADASMVLLKNDRNLLPLDRTRLKRIALIGPYAVEDRTGGGGSSHVIPLYSIAPVDGLDAALLSQTKIDLLDGHDIPAAVKAAHTADVAIVMVGDDEGEDHDHPIALSGNADALVAAVAEANPKTVVVVKSGSAVLMPWIDAVSAVLEAWYPGEEDGDAVADVLLGKVNPSGKLPLTFPRSIAQTLASQPRQYPGDGVTVRYSERMDVGYRAFQAERMTPLFPFGYGLSYTCFRYADLHVKPEIGHTAIVQFRIQNVGQRAGAEVAQVYLTYPPIAEGDEPPQELRGFQKVMLQPGESAVVALRLDAYSFSYWSVTRHGWRIAPGTFRVAVGGASADTPLIAALTVQ